MQTTSSGDQRPAYSGSCGIYCITGLLSFMIMTHEGYKLFDVLISLSAFPLCKGASEPSAFN